MTRSTPKVSGSGPSLPSKWWQWLLLYPALGVALITAAPTWFDKAMAMLNNTRNASYVDAMQQNTLWRRNLTCSAAPFDWYSNPSDIKIDATICDSGDIFIRASTPDHQDFFRWVPVDQVITKPAAASDPLGGSAHAATLPIQLAPTNRRAGLPLVRVQYTTVLCQKFLDNRHLLRRVKTDNGCFDETVDTFDGRTISRTPAACTTAC